MSENLRMWMEISFNVGYLIVIWTVVVLMVRRRYQVAGNQRHLASLITWMFGLLALGDTGHVGFRVLAYMQGDLDATFQFAGLEFGWVGLGALATGITVTVFYILVVVLWQRRFNKPYGWFGTLLFASAVIRFILMLSPANEWNSQVPPQPWGTYRNLPLIILGLGAAFLILRDSLDEKDRAYAWIAWMILLSYAFYMPVIFFVQKFPVIGMLMIPKTLAYVAIAFIGYRTYFKPGKVSGMSKPLVTRA